MSAAGRPGVIRDHRDFYATPKWCIDAVLPYLDFDTYQRIIDPGCGRGAILDAVHAAHPNIPILGIEKDKGLFQECFTQHDHDRITIVNASFFDISNATERNLVISNPPYSLAQEFVEHALSFGENTDVCMLLRLPFLASKKRRALFEKSKPDIFVLPRRPSFTPDGKTDATEYAWFNWSKLASGRWFRLDEKEKGAA